MRIAVVGAGGVGGYFGGRLAQAGEDVVFIARGATLDALRSRGLRVDSILGDFEVRPAQATDNPAQVGPVDVVLMAVKAWQVPEAAASIRPLIGPDTCVVPIQNGVDAPDQIAAAVGSGHAVGGMCGLVTQIVAPGHIRHSGSPGPAPIIKCGELDNRPSPRLTALRDALMKMGIDAEVPPDIRVTMWWKLVAQATWSGMGSITRSPIGVWRSLPETRAMALQSMEEVAGVARVRGVALPADAVASGMRTLDSFPSESTSSMQRDMAAGRPSELEALVGAVVRMGREAGVPTPVQSAIYASLLPQELRARGQLQFDG